MALVQEGLTSEVVLQTFFGRHIQTLWVRVHMLWLYDRPTDPTRELTKELTYVEVYARIKSVLEVGAMVDAEQHPTPLCQGVP
jgi:hypothetical protein